MVQSDGREVMVDLATGDVTMIDNRKKEYSVLTQAQIEAAVVQMQERMKQGAAQASEREERMKNLPPAMRERMQRMMGGMAAGVTVERGAGSREIAGYACDDWTIKLGAFSTTEQCLSTALPLPAQAWDNYKRLADRMTGLMSAMGPMGTGLAEMQAKFEKMKGIPLWAKTSVRLMGQTHDTLMEVTEVRQGPIPASAWEIPAGYKEVDSPLSRMAAPPAK
jgi:hypothetical protein